MDFVEDLAQLRQLNEAGLLHVLRSRFASGLVHCYAGPSLLCLNPRRPLAIYSEKVMRLVRDCPGDDLPPHVFAAAQAAHAALVSSRRDQALVLLGRSGAGKTGAARQLLQYLAVTCAPGARAGAPMAEKLTAASALLESFGNCRTWANANASRFSQLTSLDFDGAGLLVSASVQALMLERWRASGLREGQPSFHIFHYLLAGAGDGLRKELFLDSLEEENPFATPQRKPEERSKSALLWELVQGSLLTLAVREAEARALWGVLAAVCHLGQAAAHRGAGGRPQFRRGDSAQRAALLLGASVEDLHRAVFGHEACRTGDPQEPLQDLVAALYLEAFGAVVSLVNRALAGPGRSVSSLQVLDCPGWQGGGPASLEDLCHNYLQERLQLLFHQHTFQAQQERYHQEKVSVEGAGEVASPEELVALLDRTAPQGARGGDCGLLQLLDDEALYPGNTDAALLERLLRLGPLHDGLLQPGPRKDQFVLSHQLGTLQVTYGVQGWLRAAREGPASRQALPLLQESHREPLAQLFGPRPAGDAGTVPSLRRTPSLRRAQAAAKRRSLPLQLKATTDALLEALRRLRLHFVLCLVPSERPEDDGQLDVALLRSQLRGSQVLDAVRVHKQGFPENLQCLEFVRRYSLLADCVPEAGDERAAAEALLGRLGLGEGGCRLGLSQVFLRAGTLSQLEARRQERLSHGLVRLQAMARGCLARRRHQQRKVQAMAVCCIQRNVRRFLEIRDWPWWRLFVKIAPVLDVHRTEEQLRASLEQVEQLRARLEKAEKERSELRQSHDLLEAKVADLWADLGQEQAASAQAAEMLEAEAAERLRLDKEVRDLQARCCQLQQQKDRLETEAVESRTLRSADFNGHLSDEDDGMDGSSVYKHKYERAVREAEASRRKASQQHEEELEKQLLARKATEKRLAEALSDLEEGRQALAQWKRKAQKLAAELQDLRLLVEEHMARNAELERRQRRFDGELSAASEGVRQERAQREKLQREKEALCADKLSLEQELSAVRSELDSQHDKLSGLRREMDELSFASHGEEEVAQLKRGRQELERRSREQEEELEDLAGQVQLLEQAKLRLEMALEKQRQEHRREASLREEEMDEARAAASKKLRNLESLLEAEQEERQALCRQRQELERRLGELQALPPPRDPQVERRLRRDLRRTRALLGDAQQRLEGAREGQAPRALLRQLRNQLEDAEFAKTAAMKARQGAETELQEVQSQLEEALRTKNESEGRCGQLAREKSALQMQLEELEEEQAELLRKYRAAVHQMAGDQKVLAEQGQQILDLESEKHQLREQVHDLSSKMDHLSSRAEDSHAVRRLEAKVRDLESRLELEQTSKTRLESQVARVKEQAGRLQQQCEQACQREQASQEGCRRLQRQLRELREDCAGLQQREAEAHQRCHELELSLENAEADLQGTRQDLRLACQRVQDLQAALEEGLDSGTDDDDSETESDPDVDSLLRRHGLGPRKMAAGDWSPVPSRRSSGSLGPSPIAGRPRVRLP